MVRRKTNSRPTHPQKQHVGRHWVYGLADPVSGDVRYVGETGDLRTRFGAHVSVALKNASRGYRMDEKDQWIVALAEQGLIPSLVILAETTSENALDDERLWVNLLSENGKLLNRIARNQPTQQQRLTAYGINLQLLRMVQLAGDTFRKIGESNPEIAAVSEHFDKMATEVEGLKV